VRPAAAVLAALCALSCVQPPPTASSRVPAPPSAEGLIPADSPAPMPKWSDRVDYLALREAYGARVDFGDRCEAMEIGKRAATALVEQQYDEVIVATAAGLDRCPVWPQLHLWRAVALQSLGRGVEADVHKRWFFGLTQSILDSGDGKTAQTPYVTISTGEEYAVLTRLGLQPTGQALIAGERMLDLLTAVDESGRETQIYFDPAWHFVRLNRAFENVR